MRAELTLAQLAGSPGLSLGPGPWRQVGSRELARFAAAASLGPAAAPAVAPPLYVLSLVPVLLEDVLVVVDERVGLNYGLERARFPAPVPAGAEVRLRGRVATTGERGGGVLYRLEVELELRGAAEPALVAELLYLAYGEAAEAI